MTRPPRWVLVSSLLAPVLLIGGWTAAAAVQPTPFDQTVQTISDLAARDTPHRAVMTGALVCVGVSHLVTAYGLWPAAIGGRLLLALGGLATLLVAVFPLPAGGGSSSAHTAAAAVSFLSLSLWPALGSRRLVTGRPPSALLAPRVSAAATGALLLALAWFLGESVVGGGQIGLAERAAAGAQALWPLAVVISVRRRRT